MSERNHDEQLGTSAAQVPKAQETVEAAPEEALRKCHVGRTRSAASRAAATCHYIEQQSGGRKPEDGVTGKEISWKAAHAARVSAQAVAVLSESAPDPAADSRCARNASASAAQAAQMGQLHDGSSELSVAAFRAALKASQAAADAAGSGGMGENETLNAKADAAEAAAVAAAEKAGWIEPGQNLPQVSTGLRSPDLMSMMHL